MRALNELVPLMGLELTATPFVETARGTKYFRNLIYSYTMAQAIEDGLVKEPAVVTRENFVASGKPADLIESVKLEDGVRLHESVKLELEAYAREHGKTIVKPLMLVIARHTAHAARLMRLIKSSDFFEGRYADKVIQVDSSVNEDETIARLLRVESADEPTEIVIHVNMLKEGWDVNNLYTIVPLRAAEARTLVVQSIGRGSRLPYGERTGVPALDRLYIVAHDRFQEIVDDAKKPDSPLRMQQVVLPEGEPQKTVMVVSRPLLHTLLGFSPARGTSGRPAGFQENQTVFSTAEQAIVKIVYDVVFAGARTGPDFRRELHTDHPCAKFIGPRSDGRTWIDRCRKCLSTRCRGNRRHNLGPDRPPHDRHSSYRLEPENDVSSGIQPFSLDLSGMRYEPPSETLWAAHLRTGEIERIRAGPDNPVTDGWRISSSRDYRVR